MCVFVQSHIAQGTERKLLTDELLAEMLLTSVPGKRYSYVEIAEFCKLTPPRIRQIEKGALMKLRKNPEINKLWKEIYY